MRRCRGFGGCLSVVVLLVAVGAASAGDGVFDPFDPRPLDASERRLLQAALATAGDYRGELDGVWGLRSQARSRPMPARGSARRRSTPMPRRWCSGSSRRSGATAGTSAPARARPLARAAVDRLGPPEAEEGGERRWSHDGSLTVLTHRFDAAQAARGMTPPTAQTPAPKPARAAATPTCWSPAASLRDGRRFYTRSDRTGDGWATVYLAGDADDGRRAQPRRRQHPARAAAALGPAGRRPADARWSSETAAFFDRRPAERSGRRPAPDAGGPAAGRRRARQHRHRLLPRRRARWSPPRTWSRPAPGSRWPTAASSTLHRLRPRPRHRGTRGARPARRWLSLADGAGARLGQRVHAAGFPYYAIAGTSLNLTSGNVSALAGVDDDPRFFSFTAPVQPGNSGGPLIDAHGAVLGLVVARLSEDFIVEATGTLPQNVNYALAELELADFLAEPASRRRPAASAASRSTTARPTASRPRWSRCSANSPGPRLWAPPSPANRAGRFSDGRPPLSACRRVGPGSRPAKPRPKAVQP